MTGFLKSNALRTGVAAVLGIIGGASVGPGTAVAANCADADGASFICGVNNVEDLQVLPGGDWIIGSDLAGLDNQGYFWLFNRNHDVRPIDPSDISIGSGGGDGSCPGVPDWSVFEPHGLGMREIGGKTVFVAINHGGRETLEFFDVDMGAAEPTLTWTGCTVAPEGQWPDDIAVMPDGSLFVTSLWDPSDETRVEKLIGGKPVGGMLSWSAGDGWAVVPGYDGVSGPNGIIAGEDGEDVFIAAWSGKKILHAKTDDMAAFTEVAMDYPPDNLNWSRDGKTILVGGIAGTILEALQCLGTDNVNCPDVGLRVDRYDPEAGTVEPVIAPRAYGVLGTGTGAVEVGDEIWVSVFRGDRIAVFPRN